MNILTTRMASAVVTVGLIFAGPVAGMASDQSSQQGMKGEANQSFDSFQKESEAGLKMDGDRGAPGINSGGQAIKPGEGEQDGRPGTIFGGPASLPPQNEAVQYEGADKGKKNATFYRERGLGSILVSKRTSSKYGLCEGGFAAKAANLRHRP